MMFYFIIFLQTKFMALLEIPDILQKQLHTIQEVLILQVKHQDTRIHDFHIRFFLHLHHTDKYLNQAY